MKSVLFCRNVVPEWDGLFLTLLFRDSDSQKQMRGKGEMIGRLWIVSINKDIQCKQVLLVTAAIINVIKSRKYFEILIWKYVDIIGIRTVVEHVSIN